MLVSYLRGSLVASAVALVLTFAAAISARADGSVATLHPVGVVSLNDVAVDRPTPVFVGDKIATGHGSIATIVSEGTKVEVPDDSTIVYTDREILVLRNNAMISTLRGMSARAGVLRATPDAAAAAQFEVTRVDAGGSVTVTKGSLSIQDGARSLHLDDGYTFSSTAEESPLGGPASESTPTSGELHALGSTGSRPPLGCHRPPESPTRPCPPHYYYGPDDCNCAKRR